MTVVHFNQPRFLPTLNYFQRMLIVDYFVYRDDVQYQSKDWENRNKVKVGKGKWAWLTVPIQAASKGTRITEVLIDDSRDWRTKMCKTVQMAYARADHFKTWFPRFEEIIQLKISKQPLIMLNYALIDMFRDAWDLNRCRFLYASDFACKGNTDTILIHMCHTLGSDIYLSGAEGRNYNDPARWQKAGIELHYHDYQHPKYWQPHGGLYYFLAWMSALDLLLNCGSDQGREILETGSLEYLSRFGKLAA